MSRAYSCRIRRASVSSASSAVRLATTTRASTCRTRTSSFASMKRRPSRRLAITSPMRLAISCWPFTLVVPGEQVLEWFGPTVVPFDLRSPIRGRTLDEPGLGDPVGDAVPGEGFPVVVIEPARPPPGDASRLQSHPSRLEVEDRDPVAGRRLGVSAIDARPPQGTEHALVARAREGVAVEEPLGGDEKIGNRLGVRLKRPEK